LRCATSVAKIRLSSRRRRPPSCTSTPASIGPTSACCNHVRQIRVARRVSTDDDCSQPCRSVHAAAAAAGANKYGQSSIDRRGRSTYGPLHQYAEQLNLALIRGESGLLSNATETRMLM